MQNKLNNHLVDSSQAKGVEILCIGTELLLGNILNSNAKWLAEELASIGLAHYRQTVIGDNFSRLRNVVLEASERSRILITTGGLGPTPDDLTTETIANAFNQPLLERNDIWENIQKKLNTQRCSLASNNRKQAFLPIEAEEIPNPSGTAPGMIWSPKQGFTIMTFPGVPSEMKNMWTQSAIPWLRKNGGTKKTFLSKTLHFANIPESKLAEELNDLMKNTNPTIAPYASLGEVKLRITAKSQNIREAENLIIPIENEIRKRTGLKCFGSNEDSLASVVLELLKKRGESLAVAESCTGGGIGAALTAIPGSSDVFRGGIIAYENSIKTKLLQVPENLLTRYGAVSKQVVEAMAQGVRQTMQTDWSIAVSGLAGPSGGNKSKPIGLVQFCIAGPTSIYSGPEFFSPYSGRLGIQKLSVLKALDKLRLFLLNKS
tara:strand:+ start:3706 stop:5001 length:1296 start_codon:yes stop_codon:yes gene_type:complete